MKKLLAGAMVIAIAFSSSGKCGPAESHRVPKTKVTTQ